MSTPRAIRYWDAVVFLALLKNETDRLDEVQAVLRAAEAGRILIVTSSISMVEVVKLDKKQAVVAISPDDCVKIDGFFKRSYISVRLVDPAVSTLARDLIWQHGLKTRDALHVATASRYRIPQLDTYDQELLDLNGTIPGLTISQPNLPVQKEMADYMEPEQDGDDSEQDQTEDMSSDDGI